MKTKADEIKGGQMENRIFMSAVDNNDPVNAAYLTVGLPTVFPKRKNAAFRDLFLSEERVGKMKDEIKGAVNVVLAIAECIREVKRIPNGHLWAACMNKLSFSDYQKTIEILKNAGVIEEKNSELIWAVK